MSKNERYTIEIQDEIINELREENEQLRGLVEAGKEDRNAIDELVDENMRLRRLIWRMADGARYENDDEPAVLTEDFNELKEEVDDESE